MASPATPVNEPLEQTEEAPEPPALPLSSDPAMIRICIELFTRATLYAGAIGLIAGLAAAFFFGE